MKTTIKTWFYENRDGRGVETSLRPPNRELPAGQPVQKLAETKFGRVLVRTEHQGRALYSWVNAENLEHASKESEVAA